MTTYYPVGDLEVGRFPRRQAEVVGHAAHGLTDKEIAREMGISPWTVQDALKDAVRRAAAKNQKDLLVKACLQGWIKARNVVPALLICLTAALSPALQYDDDHDWKRGTRVLRLRGRRDEPGLLVLPDLDLLDSDGEV